MTDTISNNENKIENSNSQEELNFLIEEIQTIVGLNFESSIVEDSLKENNFNFLQTVASILGK